MNPDVINRLNMISQADTPQEGDLYITARLIRRYMDEWGIDVSRWGEYKYYCLTLSHTYLLTRRRHHKKRNQWVLLPRNDKETFTTPIAQSVDITDCLQTLQTIALIGG